MVKYTTREEIRELDRKAIEDYKIPGILLMENAGAGAARAIMTTTKGPIAIFCGKGNNGGDGFVIARHLYNNNIDTSVFFVGELNNVVAESDSGINLCILRNMGIRLIEIRNKEQLEQNRSHWENAVAVVDALLGTGLSGSVKEPMAGIMDCISSWQKPVFAIDIPSGLDANTGEILGITIPATMTTTFALPKIGFSKGDGAKVTGKVVVIDISIPRDLLGETS